MIVPPQILNQHTIVLGKTRSGKSSTMRLLIEGLLDEQKPVCIIDPKGDWWGLKSSASGKRAGYPVIIFGGDRADVPINAHSGGYVAELVATGNRPCIIDLGGWTVSDRTQFFVGFAAALFRHTRGPRWLCIDEVHNFCPQGKVQDPQAGMMLHWANRLASEGAGKGITLISASQRPQKVHKDFVTSNETLIAMRVIHPLDRAAIKDWIDGCDDPDKGKEVLTTLASMKRGEGWVWSPEISFGPKRIQFPLFNTFDSFKAPSSEVAAKLTGWAEVDLDEVKAKLVEVVEEAKANDPKILKARIRELESMIEQIPNDLTPKITAEELSLMRGEGYREGYAQGSHQSAVVTARKVKDALITYGGRLIKHREQIAAAVADDGAYTGLLADLDEIEAQLYKTNPGMPKPEPSAENSPPRQPPAKRDAPVVPRLPSSARDDDGALPGPHQRILDSVAFWIAVKVQAPSRVQVAFMAGYRPTGTYDVYLSRMKSGGLIYYAVPGSISLTEQGWKLARWPDNRPTPRDIQARILPLLDGPHTKIMTKLFAIGQRSISREELAAACDYKQTGTWDVYLSRLKSVGLITYPSAGMVASSDWIYS